MSIRSMETDRSMIVEDTKPAPAPRAEVVVKGRNVEIPDHFRIYVSEKLSRLERFDRSIYLFDVELDHERTIASRPPIRAPIGASLHRAPLGLSARWSPRSRRVPFGDGRACARAAASEQEKT